MNENILAAIIKELGPTGILIAGLYWIMGRNLRNIADSIRVINTEIGEIKNVLERIYDEIKRKEE